MRILFLVIKPFSVTRVVRRQGTIEEKATVDLVAGKAVEVLVEYTNSPPPDSLNNGMDRGNAQPALMRGVVCQAFSDV